MTKGAQTLSPENYIRKRSRSLPVHECWINEAWEENRLANILICRKHSNGNYTVGLYLVDLNCLGVKNTFFRFNISLNQYVELMENLSNSEELIEVEYKLAHNIIFSSIAFAEEYGFNPHKDFSSTMQYFLEEDNENVELIEIECGHNGMPMYIKGPHESDTEAKRILTQLEKTAGNGNYKFIDGPDTT